MVSKFIHIVEIQEDKNDAVSAKYIHEQSVSLVFIFGARSIAVRLCNAEVLVLLLLFSWNVGKLEYDSSIVHHERRNMTS